MPLTKKIPAIIINYFPGIVILILGIAILCYTAQMIAAEYPDEYGKDVYWDIAIISVAGLILVMLNGYRIQQFYKASEENRKNLSLLQSRQLAIESSRDGLMIIDRAGILTYINRAFLNIYGIDSSRESDFLGKVWHKIYSENGNDIHKIKYEVLPMLESQGYWRGKIIINSKEGERTYTELSLTKLEDGGLIGSTLDITDEQRTREEKSKLEDQFFQAQKMEAIGRLTGGIAHDFNNILAAMNGYAEFLIEDLENGSPQQKFAKNILQAGKQARDVVDRMLAFSRRSDSAIQTIDLIDSVRETALMLRASLPRTIEVIMDLREDVAPIRGNATQIAQTIMNLCVNAKDAMDDDRGILILRVHRMISDDFELPWVLQDDLQDPRDAAPIRIDDLENMRTRLVLGLLKKNTDYVVLRVQDSGAGMGRSVMEHIFEPFFTTKPVDKGTGLGLATVHGVMTSHQGMLIVDSTIGIGTIFDLYFPYVGNPEAFLTSEYPELNSKNQDDEGARGKISILLVEDQEHVRDMMCNMLVRFECTVDIASDGLEALDAIRERPERYDLVITDHNMPRMTGLELVQQVYMDFPDLPFIIFSGYSEKEIQDIQEGHPAIKSILRKPVSRDVLEQHIKAVVRQRKNKT